MQSSKVIENNCSPIDFSNLCGGNDYAALTDGYNRKKITELVWSVQDDSIRVYVKNAIYIQKRLDSCPEDDDELYEKTLGEQVELQERFCKEILAISNNQQKLDTIEKKVSGYNTTESSVLMYFLMDLNHVNTSNQGEKNCLQKNAQKAYSKTFGWKEKSYEGKINLDFTDPATRTAMEKVANDYKDVCPDMVAEIWNQYNEYEQDFYEKYPEKLKKIAV